MESLSPAKIPASEDSGYSTAPPQKINICKCALL
jgi:hypothetical protein